MSKTKEELLQYAIKMRQQGDTLYEIRKYLDRNTSDTQAIKEIITIVSELEEDVSPIQQKKKIPALNLLLGTFLILSGVVLVVILWEQGFVAKLPIVMVVVGIYALTSPKFDRQMKSNFGINREDNHLTKHKTRFKH
jgi:DNA-binding transcriptional MerR regulator